MRFDSQTLSSIFSYINREVFGGSLIVPNIIAVDKTVANNAARFNYREDGTDPKIMVYKPAPYSADEWLYSLAHEMAHYALYDKYLRPLRGNIEAIDKKWKMVDHTGEWEDIMMKILPKLKLKYDQQDMDEVRNSSLISYRQSDLLDLIKPKIVVTIDVYYEKEGQTGQVSEAADEHFGPSVTVFYTGDIDNTSFEKHLSIDHFIHGRQGTTLGENNFWLQYDRDFGASDKAIKKAMFIIGLLDGRDGIRNTIETPDIVSPIDIDFPTETLHFAHFDISEEQLQGIKQ